MYGLDINFLNDRPEYKPVPTERRRGGGGIAPGDLRATLLGLAVGLSLLALSGGSWFFLQAQNNQLRERQSQLDAELGVLKAEQARLGQINTETQQIRAESAALAGVFNAIKPWSATFADISSRTPPDVRIVSITQKEPPASQQRRPAPAPSPSPSPGASPAATPTPAAAPEPPPTGIIEIKGQATSFNNVNDFLLVLQNSKFLKGDKTQIVGATLGEPRTVQLVQIGKQTGQAASGVNAPKLPPEVSFTIQTELTDVPASELIQELESQKATGLVTRIERLQQKGVVKP
ncbi:MAG: PilN domain-containing protein [Leptolyngbyaceae cyanobacterium bins.349]|nr:PilN domain-containing protein [Leptolyngbyaceae cyanobacterium bins.349]